MVEYSQYGQCGVLSLSSLSILLIVCDLPVFAAAPSPTWCADTLEACIRREAYKKRSV
jgi:hypothetical protein